MFGWGEHVFYNVFLDYMIGGAFAVRGNRNFTFEHELERWTTIYDVTWQKDQEKTLNEIEAIFEYKIHDPETWINNRHSDYFAGRRTGDTLTFIKHSGLFAHAFAFLYSKTSDKKHLDWANKSADLFWGHRDPRTNLVRGCIQRKEEPVAPGGACAVGPFPASCLPMASRAAIRRVRSRLSSLSEVFQHR